MLNQLERFNQMSLLDKAKFFQWLSQFPALSLIACWRADLGYRFLNPLAIGSTVLAMVGIAAFCQPQTKPVFLLAHAAVFFLCASYLRFKRWREFRRGVRQHTFYIGSTGVRNFLVPNFCRRHRLYERFLEPLVFAAFGVFIFRELSPAWGVWLVGSAICLHVMEQSVHEKEQERQMDMVDGLVSSEVQGAQVERFSEPVAGAQTAQPSAGIATGLSPDLEDLIARRAKRRRSS